jgi:hypothetical protein
MLTAMQRAMRQPTTLIQGLTLYFNLVQGLTLYFNLVVQGLNLYYKVCWVLEHLLEVRTVTFQVTLNENGSLCGWWARIWAEAGS